MTSNLRLFLLVVFAILLAGSIGSVSAYRAKVPDLIVTLVGTFWGFFLTQIGLMVYERSKAKQEYLAMLAAARNEIHMNKGTVTWIDYLIREKVHERNIHGLGFSGVDEISATAAENLVHSPLTYQFSRTFAANRLLTIFQTLLQFRKEIFTDEVDGEDPVRYKGIKFDKVISSFDTLAAWIDAEGARLVGPEKWEDIAGAAARRPQDLVTIDLALKGQAGSVTAEDAEAHTAKAKANSEWKHFDRVRGPWIGGTFILGILLLSLWAGPCSAS